ncbi:unnamed protein product [Trichogramma brassicae]|uniref:HAP1 N-terminal domain-containing protein n=1 Tax=Trichogramma brassicae TaxID=86971 RepID=A0A6H5J7C5_9HYME|nr:unnamed protein product [Trichogramma brassicae]
MLPRKESPFEAQAGSGQYALEDMISSLQTRGAQLDDEEDELSQDPAQLLAQRDRDLVLAAELGKALLERNQELTRQSEALAENYASKIEAKLNNYCIRLVLLGLLGAAGRAFAYCGRNGELWPAICLCHFVTYGRPIVSGARLATAHCSGVRPNLSRASIFSGRYLSLLSSNNIFARSSLLPFLQIICRDVDPSLLATFGSAPFFKSNSSSSLNPKFKAKCRGESPVIGSRQLGSWPSSRNLRTTSSQANAQAT